MSDQIRGFIDLQVNGWRGTDFSAPGLSAEACGQAFREILQSGTGAFLATVITSGTDIYESNLPVIAAVRARPEFRDRVLGVHLEGPFLSPQDGARGAHPLRYVRAPDPDELARLVELGGGCVRLVTLAAGIPGAGELISAARKRGIAVSLGHQTATYDELRAAAEAGAASLTHLGNGMPATVDRHANPLLDGLACDGLAAMIITDGHHLPDQLIKTIVRVKGAEGIIVTSDATALSGMPPGTYEMFGSVVERNEAGKVYNPATGYLAGSGSSIFACMNHLASLGLLSRDELIQAGCTNALRLIDASPPPGFTPPEYDEDHYRFLPC